MFRFRVILTPRAAVNAVDGLDDTGALRLRVRVAPVKGAANEAMLRYLAEVLAISRSDIAIVGGIRSRRKLVEVHESARRRLIELWPDLKD